MSQESLLPEVEIGPRAYARGGDPRTSWRAADSIPAQRLTETKERILVLLKIKGAMTDEELIDAYRKQWPESKTTDQSIRSRRSELVKQGLAEDSGEKGSTSHGGKSVRWRAA